MHPMSKGERVFVVDDDPSVRKGLARLLRTAGHDIQAFASASEFLNQVDADVSGCLILDARMPGLSGKELQEELRARGVRLPVIFVTADDDPATRGRARAMKAAGFFRKPVDGTALLDAITWAVESERRGGQNRGQ
jgi:FixJ family two-component response regulator